ncbi:MAG: hypothetical protein LCH92_16775 [Proteobacteria bacterium]|nr:hypothetical protein [Pseudomonadota bacterium]
MRAALALSLAVTAGGAGAQSLYDGTWTFLDAASCRPGSDAVVRVTLPEIRYYESLCRLSNPVPVRGMEATLYDADCAGEGETWHHRLLLMRTDDGQLLQLQDGFAQLLNACPAEAPAAAPGK